MIANISHTELVKPLIEYNEKKVEKGEAERIHYSGFNENADKKTVISHFAIHTRDSKRKDKNMHVSLNFPIEDNKILSNDFLKIISKDYLKKLGFPDDHPYIVYRHYDTFQTHIHIVTPKIIEGKKIINDSNLYLRSQQITRELEISHGLKQLSSIKNNKKEIPNEILVREEILDVSEKRKKYSYAVDFILKNYNPISLLEFNEQLKLVGLEAISTTYLDKNNNENIGIQYKHEFINDLPLNASSLFNNPGHTKLEKVFKNNVNIRKRREKEISEFIKGKVFNKYHNLSYEIFEKELLKIDIEVKYTYKNGQVAAYRLFDKRENIFYKPSGIDRSLSFGNIKDRVGTVVKRNYSYHNVTLVYVLDKKYKELYPEKNINIDTQHYVMFMAKNGMVPDVYNGKLRFNNYLNKNPSENDYSSLKNISIKKLDFNEISNFVHSKNYKSEVWHFQKKIRNEDDKNSSLPTKGMMEVLMNSFDKLMDMKVIKDTNSTTKSSKKQNL